MTRALRYLLPALTAACVLGASASLAQSPSSPSLPAEGQGGRSALTSWTMRQDSANRGLGLGWQKGDFSGAAVSVPNVIDPQLYSGQVAVSNYEGSIAWYRTTFKAPVAGTYALTFESANWQATVWIDGRQVASHQGSYLPFEARATVAAGTHTVVVRVDWQNPHAQELLGFHRTWFNWGGIDGEVNVREIGESELLHPSIQTKLPAGAVTSSSSATVTVGVEVRNDGASGQAIATEGALTHGSQSIALHFPEAHLAHGQTTTVSTTVTVPEPALWSPTSPNLYELTLSAGAGASFSAHVGLRQLTWYGGRVYLNGARLVLHGATIQEDAQGHGDALTPSDEGQIVSELKAIGANAVRSQHPLYPGLLERLDAAGILVWQGIGPVEGAGNWFSNGPGLTAAAENQARSAVLAEQLHPSIFAWNLVDEMAGNGRDSSEDNYIESMTRWLHGHDPGRMVAVDVWGDHPPTHPGAVYREVDAVAETDYSGWYDHPHNSPAGVSAEIARRLTAMQRTFAGKVLVISEFGAESNGLNASSSPGGYAYQAQLLARHIRMYAADSQLSGMFVYLLRDYPLNPTFSGGSIHLVLPNVKLIEGLDQKGLFMYNGAPKPAVSVVASLYKALPQI
jgi:hypothetical protein